MTANVKPRGARSHRHEFSALWGTFGPYGRQDVHYHCCYAGCWDGPIPDDACQRILVGPGSSCDGRGETHHRETLA